MSNNVTELEYAVLLKFCEAQNAFCPSKDEISVVSRKRSEVGFMTAVTCAKPFSYSERVYEQIPPAMSLSDGTMIGFLLYFDNGLLKAVEGFCYGERWPTPEWPVRFLRVTEGT
jgi:hypothetical protein